MALNPVVHSHAKIFGGALAFLAAFAVGAASQVPRPSGPGASQSSTSQSGPNQVTEMPAPLPKGARQAIDVELARAYPAIAANGTKGKQVVWFFADRESRIVGSEIGTMFTAAELQRLALQPRYDSMHVAVYEATLKARNGAPINAVWAGDQVPWETHLYPSEKWYNMIVDSIHTLQPKLWAELRPGQAVYIDLDFRTHRIGQIWAGPAFNDRKAQWEHAKARYPDRNVIITTDLVVNTQDGRRIPIVDIHRTPWAQRYSRQ